MNINESKSFISKKVKEFLKNGGTLVKEFGSNPKCDCPIGCVTDHIRYNIVLVASRELGWTTEQVWSFVYGFDSGANSSLGQDNPKHVRLGEWFNKTYLKNS